MEKKINFKENYIEVNFKKTRCTAKENLNGKMVRNMLGNGKKEFKKE
jgi:hypothetical protein